jgi:hypothetical protein
MDDTPFLELECLPTKYVCGVQHTVHFRQLLAEWLARTGT